MKLLELEIENILSIEKATIKFQDSGLVLVEGWNYDAQRANGAGKTAILNAISFALYDKVPRKITATEILRRGAKQGYCNVTFAAGPGDGDVYVVRRSRPKGCEVQRNGQLITISQVELEAAIRLSYEQFLISMYSSQGTKNKFLSLADSDKKDFLLKLLNLQDFEACNKLTGKKIKSFETDVAALTAQNLAIASKLEAYQESVSGVPSGNIEEYSQVMKALSDIKAPDLSKFKKVEADIDSKRKMFLKAHAERGFFHTQIRQLQSKVKSFDGSDTCDSCGTKIDISDAKVHHDVEQAKLSENIRDIKNLIDNCDLTLQNEKPVEVLHTKLKEKLAKESKQYDDAQRRITELKALIKERELKKEIFDKIAVLKLQETKFNLEIANKNRTIELYNTISTMCSPMGAQAYILDSIIDSFNEYVSEYVSLVWPNASYKLIAYRENGKGDVTAKFSDQLAMDGVDVSIGSLSGGECKALSLCSDFAILDIMKTLFGLDINPIILDEPFEGLDAVGKEIVIDLLEKLSIDRQIIVVDHSSEAKAMFSKVIRVEKRQGISSVTMDI